MIDTEAYTLRIARATPAELVVINYELITAFLREALEALDSDENGVNQASFERGVQKAQDGLTQLIRGLRLDISIAQDLYRIYHYLYKRLTDAYFQRDRSPVEEALSLINLLLDGWREAAKQETYAAPAQEIPEVFAGLTYQRGGLSEYIVEDEGRGFKA